MFKNQQITIIITTIIVTLGSFLSYDLYKKYNPSDEEIFQKGLYDLAYVNDKKDSTRYADEKENTPSAADIFVRYLENKLAFNEHNEGKSFVFTGDITEIKTSIMGCSVITFKIIGENDEPMGQINCLNCHNLVDKWKKKLLHLKVGDQVRIKGKYSSALAENTMTFNNCKIIESPKTNTK